ncbi:MAG: hypothetical protein COA42_03460 [Alteromonadaceae bacterium]|nr:MAG: hypothetical protein COA42_03460 [Alteromonadaceae bacterium]
MSNTVLTDDQREIVELLIHELAEVDTQDVSLFGNESFEQQDELLFDLNIHLEHIGNALDLAGLPGLASCCKHWASNYRLMHEQTVAGKPALLALTQQLAHECLAYLQNLCDQKSVHAHAVNIIDGLSVESWIKPLTKDEQNTLIEQFNISTLSNLSATLQDDEIVIPRQAGADMCDLSVSSDIRPELLQGMLIELPGLVEQFEESILQYVDSLDANDLAQAQRVAHTLKGAANIVSVKGVANLMHYAEDMLETAVKPNAVLPAGFNSLLIDTSDCLASTADYLNRQGGYPDNLQDTLQQVLDCIHQLKDSKEQRNDTTAETATDLATTEARATDITSETPLVKTEGKQATIITPEPEFAAPPQVAAPPSQVSPPANNTPTAVDDNSERIVTIPERVSRELMRLSGETQIVNNQVSAHIESIQNNMSQCDQYHKKIRAMAAEFDALVQTQSALRAASSAYEADELDPLEMERFNELDTFANQLSELTTDSYEAISGVEDQLKELSTLSISQKQFNSDNQQILLDMNLLPVESYSARFSRCVRQACRLTGKSATLTMEGDKLLIDSHVLNRIADPLMHLLRNAVDHGLEPNSEARVSNGKSAQGNIKLSFILEGEIIKITCSDDGQGLNYKDIRNSAIQKGLIDYDAHVTTKLLNQIILMPGFTTREQVNQTSGRGIGLDAVANEIKNLKGNISIDSTRNNGCTFTISVPTSILTGHAIVTRCRNQHSTLTYSILSRSVKQIIYIKDSQLTVVGTRKFYTFEDARLPVYMLSDLLGTHPPEGTEVNALLIATRNDDTLVAIAVESIIASQELVIKPLNRFTFQPDGVIGATILGDGTVSPVINVQELPGMGLNQEELQQLLRHRDSISAHDADSDKTPPAALIVDDSLSARRSLAQLVSDMGMEVYTAKDGFDAISVIENKKPSLMLVDLEMPRMNGLELTNHIRSRDELKDIPVIMITSRSTAKHKEMARNAGVTTYMTKPWSEDELMRCIEKEIA